MASSSPEIQAFEVPSEVPPNNTFTIDATVGQTDAPDPWLSSGGCTTSQLDVTGWLTPVTLWIDGQREATRELCMANNNSRDVSFSASLSSGTHTVELKVHPVGDVHSFGETWKDNLDVVADDVSQSVGTSSSAPDPSMPSSSDRLLMFLQDVADAIGTSVNMVAVGIVVAVGVILFL